MHVEGIGRLPLSGKQSRSFGVGFKEKQQVINGTTGTHKGILCRPFHLLGVGRLVAVGTHTVHASSAVETHNQQAGFMTQHLVELYSLADT